MDEKTNMSEVIDEVKNASEEELQEVIEKWFESTRTDGMKLGAYYISAAVAGAIEKNLKKGSLRDYQRAIKRVMEIVSVQLTKQNDLATEETIEQDGEEI